MSNLIKAYSIRYDESVKKIDMNKKSEELAQKFVDDYISENIAIKQIDFGEVSRKLQDEHVLTGGDVDFTPGINATVLEKPSRTEEELAELEAKVCDKRAQLDDAQERLEQVRQEADKILLEAKEQVESMLEDARMQAEEEKQAIYENARQEGYNDGINEAASQVEQLKDSVAKEREQLNIQYEQQVDELEPAFTELLCKYVKKLTGIYSEDKKSIINYLIDSTLKNIYGCENFFVRVSSEDYPSAAEHLVEMKNIVGEKASLELIEDKMLEKNKCLIETDSRIFDCSLDGQLDALIEDIKLLSEKE